MASWIPEAFPSLLSTRQLPASLCSILDLHPSTKGFTCVAVAVSKGRRCRNRLDMNKRDQATSIIGNACRRIQEGQDPGKVWKESLETLGQLLVCERHGEQVNDIMMRWACVMAEFYAGHHG